MDERIWIRWGIPLGWGARFALTALLTACQLGGEYAPFALGAVAACGGGSNGLCALLGLTVGALAFMDFVTALPCLAVGVLLYTATTAFVEHPVLVRREVVAFLGSVLFFAVECIYLFQSYNPESLWGPCLSATFLLGCATYLYRPLLDRKYTTRDQDSLLFLGITLALSLGDVMVIDLSLGRIFLSTLILFTAYQRGMSTGVGAGLTAGLMADLCAQTQGLVFAASYGLGALAAGWFSARGRTRGAMAYFGAVLLSTLAVSQEAGQWAALEALITVPVFLLLPQRLFGGKRVQSATSPPHTANQTRERMRTQLNKTASALRDLYESMGRSMAPTEESAGVVFDRAAEKVCRSCTICSVCWQKEYASTYNAFNDATPYFMERGRAMAKDFPATFSNRCIHMSDLIQALNTELSTFLLRRQYRRELDETRRSAQGQYAQLSDLLSATAAGLGAVQPAMGGNEGYQCGAALRPKSGERLCGDTLDGFETDQGTLCLLLCDGMGSGALAQKESALTVRLLRQFLQGGIDPGSALKTLNTAMELRSTQEGSFSTVDLLTCATDSGQGALYKFGAAPSYVKKGGKVRRITSSSLPVGMRPSPTAPDITQVQVEPGSFVVLISDGVADSEDDDWLMNLLAGYPGHDPQALANLILRHSPGELDDDAAVQVLYREKSLVKAV